MSGAIHPLPQYALMARCSVKAQGQLHLYLLLWSMPKVFKGPCFKRRTKHFVENISYFPLNYFVIHFA